MQDCRGERILRLAQPSNENLSKKKKQSNRAPSCDFEYLYNRFN